MTTQQRSTVVGVFEDRQQADRAVTELRQAGFSEGQIGVATRHSDASTDSSATSDDNSKWESGAITGVLAGAGLGGLVGLGVLAGVIPVLGPVIAGGTLATILANAAGGAALAGLAGALIGAGVPEDEANYYHGEFEAGRTIVTVHAGARVDEATAILRRHGAYDMQSRGATASATATAGAATGADQTIEVREEELHAHTRPVEAGEVRVRKEVHTEHETVEVPVRREEVVIERHAPTGRHTSTSDIREGEEIRIPVMEEQVVVEKQAVVKEEVSVGKRVVEDTERVGGEVRREEVRVEREGDVDIRSRGDSSGTA